MIHSLLTISNEELMELTLARIKSVNPKINFGERLTGPTAMVLDGKLAEPTYGLPDDVVYLDFHVPHVEKPQPKTVTVQSKKIPFSSDFEDWAKFEHKYLHPYAISIPHKDWMSTYKPGDIVMVMDDQFDASPMTLEKTHFDQHSYVVFRFAVSD